MPNDARVPHYSAPPTPAATWPHRDFIVVHALDVEMPSPVPAEAAARLLGFHHGPATFSASAFSDPATAETHPPA
ncbi:hypothetical protein GCM10020220_090550 [Nonomuraea rubra]